MLISHLLKAYSRLDVTTYAKYKYNMVDGPKLSIIFGHFIDHRSCLCRGKRVQRAWIKHAFGIINFLL